GRGDRYVDALSRRRQRSPARTRGVGGPPSGTRRPAHEPRRRRSCRGGTGRRGTATRQPVRHLLVTNDFPPKVGGIQSYLWELWRRLAPDDVVVMTTPYAGSAAFDAAAPFRIARTIDPVLLPHPLLADRIKRLAGEVDA